MNFKKLLLPILVTGFIVAACAASRLYVPATSDTEQSGLSLQDLTKGRTLYVDNCSDCHNLYLPEKRTKEKWNSVFPKMQKKAHVNDADMELIKSYILARCKPDVSN
jgi:hypothetical protein